MVNDLDINLYTFDLDGSKNSEFGDNYYEKKAEYGVSIEKKGHPCLITGRNLRVVHS